MVKINPNKIKSRDRLMVEIINGITKSGIHIDKRKESDKNACREKIKEFNNE